MNDNVKMLLRYAVTGGVAFALGKGWLTPEQAGPVTDAVLQIGAAVLAVAPALYAAFFVNNAPKKS